MRFRFLEHTADAKFRAYGKSLPEVFSNAGLALFNLITDTKRVKCVVKRSFTVKAEDLESLLYDFLEELLFLHESEGLVFSRFKVSINGLTLKAVVCGEQLSDEHVIKSVVKAVTYHDMIVSDSMAQVVIDL